jgi:hypothetical protein
MPSTEYRSGAEILRLTSESEVVFTFSSNRYLVLLLTTSVLEYWNGSSRLCAVQMGNNDMLLLVSNLLWADANGDDC